MAEPTTIGSLLPAQQRAYARAERGNPDYRTYDCRTCRDLQGAVEVSTEAWAPCPTCNPLTHARWERGHLGCHTDGCRTCEELEVMHLPPSSLPSHRPSTGTWRDGVTADFD